MKFKNLLLVGVLTASISSCGSSYKTKSEIATKCDSIGYIMGAADGLNLKQSFTKMGMDSIMDINTYFEGLFDGCKAKKPRIDADSMASLVLINSFMGQIRTYQQALTTDTTGTVTAPEFTKAFTDSVGYLMGKSDGDGLYAGFQRQGFDSLGIKLQFYYEGLRDANLDDSARINVNKYGDMVMKFFDEIREKELLRRFGDNKREGEEFLAKNKTNDDVITTESGLQYTIIKEGNGEKPGSMDYVKVHYTGSLLDGTVFDSSVERGEPAVFGVFQVIPGWTEALQLMPVGSKWKLFIPQELAYGENGAGIIKPYSVLIFEVELLEIVK